MPRRNIPWDALKAAYVEGTAVDPDGDPTKRAWPTAQDVALMFGCDIGWVQRKATQDNWNDARHEFQAEQDAVRRRKLIESRADQAVKIDDRGLQAAEAGVSLIGTRLGWLIRQQTPLPQEQRGEFNIDAKELAQLGLAAKRFIDVKAHVMGQPAIGVESADEQEREMFAAQAVIAAELHAHVLARKQHEAEDAELARESAPAS